MLASRNRFHGHGSLRYVYAKGRIVRTKFFVCKTTDNRRRNEPRISVVVSKKVMKSAVRRNRIRRRLYEAIRHEIRRLNQQTDIVFIVTSPEILTADSSDIVSAVGRAFTQADLYKTAES